MSTAKHTPGPWFWGIDEDFGADSLPVLRSLAGEICNFGDDEMYYPTAGKPPNAEDARLIKAAPDLLAALQAIADIEDHMSGGWKEIEQAREIARAAIDKATGEAS